jgi:hypothetical protein
MPWRLELLYPAFSLPCRLVSMFRTVVERAMLPMFHTRQNLGGHADLDGTARRTLRSRAACCFQRIPHLACAVMEGARQIYGTRCRSDNPDIYQLCSDVPDTRPARDAPLLSRPVYIFLPQGIRVMATTASATAWAEYHWPRLGLLVVSPCSCKAVGIFSRPIPSSACSSPPAWPVGGRWVLSIAASTPITE